MDGLVVPPPLEVLGLERGAEVRFRRHPGERWKPAVLERIERDGSLGLRDPKGASRAIPVARVEVAVRGPRGGRCWEPVAARIARAEQLRML